MRYPLAGRRPDPATFTRPLPAAPAPPGASQNPPPEGFAPSFDRFLVIHRRHSYGWSFELNEWLALSLEQEGFPVRRLLARNVYAPLRPRTHQICLVEVEGALWTADARVALVDQVLKTYETSLDGEVLVAEENVPSRWPTPKCWKSNWEWC